MADHRSESLHQPPAGERAPTGMAISAAPDARTLVVPDGVGLLTAGFERRGPDLAITPPDGPALVILDYFASATPPDLVTAGGGLLASRVVTKLAGPDTVGAPALGAPGDAAPIVRPWKRVPLDPRFSGAWVVAGDLDGDGAVEIENADGKMLEIHGLINIFKRQDYPKSKIQTDTLVKALLKYSNSIFLEDDLTIIEVRFGKK